jgi:hypothetical protein
MSHPLDSHRPDALDGPALDERGGRDPDDDSFLLPEGDASELDDLDEEVTLAELERAERDRMDQMEASARLDALVRALRQSRLDGWIARVNVGAEEALVRLAPEQPRVPERWRAELPDCVALSLAERAHTPTHRAWLLQAAGETVTFSLGADDQGVPQARSVRPAELRPDASARPGEPTLRRPADANANVEA